VSGRRAREPRGAGAAGLAALALSALLVGRSIVGSAGPPAIPRGARIYVAAARDSRLFTMCPTPGQVTPPTSRAGSDVTVVATPLRDSLLIRCLQTRESAVLPLPPGRDARGADLLDRVELGRDRLAWDSEIATALERALGRRGRFRVVTSPDEADYVLLADTARQPLAAFGGQGSGGGLIVVQPGGDYEANFLSAILAIAVPADVYRQPSLDPAVLVSRSVWQGAAFTQGPQRGGPQREEPAGPASLTKQFEDQAKWPSYLPPLCAASDHPFGRDRFASPSSNASQITAPTAGMTTAPARSRFGASDVPTFSTSVTYVPVPVIVTGSDGQPVAGLTEADFRVFEDAVEQKIDRVIAMATPFSVALLVDTSASMRLKLEEVQQAVLTFIETLRGDDSLMLASFDDRVFAQSPFTVDRDRLRRGVLQMGRGAGTRLFDAIDLVAENYLDALPGRKAVVLLTDGVDTRSRLASETSTERLAAEAAAPIYAVQYDTRAESRLQMATPAGLTATHMPKGARDNAALYLKADRYLDSITSASGGRLYQAPAAQGLGDAFGQVARDLRQQYTVCYYPSNQKRDGSARSIRVEVQRPDVKIRTRAGYRAPSGPRY
jgi:Ca-activated chloride channel family protein